MDILEKFISKDVANHILKFCWPNAEASAVEDAFFYGNYEKALSMDNIDGEEAFVSACLGRHPQMIILAVTKNKNYKYYWVLCRALDHACKYNMIEIVLFFIQVREKSCDIDVFRNIRNGIIKACSKGFADIVYLLIEERIKYKLSWGSRDEYHHECRILSLELKKARKTKNITAIKLLTYYANSCHLMKKIEHKKSTKK